MRKCCREPKDETRVGLPGASQWQRMSTSLRATAVHGAGAWHIGASAFEGRREVRARGAREGR